MELVVVTIIVALAVGYAATQIFQALKNHSNPCANCTGCTLKDGNNRKEYCDIKKNDQLFGRMKKKH